MPNTPFRVQAYQSDIYQFWVAKQTSSSFESNPENSAPQMKKNWFLAVKSSILKVAIATKGV
jgi:hypothetical protein